MTGKRLYSISILRVLAMLLVVYYHCICPYYIWSSGVDCAEVTVPLYTKLSLGLLKVHLPIFFIAAGYLFGYKRFRGGGTPTSVSFFSIRRCVCLCRISR